MHSPEALSVRGLRRSFARVAVICGIDLDVGHGEIVALLGPNGSGKTTTVTCIAGLLTADAGTIRVNGESDRIRHEKEGACVPEIPVVYDDLCPREHVQLCAKCATALLTRTHDRSGSSRSRGGAAVTSIASGSGTPDQGRPALGNAGRSASSSSQPSLASRVTGNAAARVDRPALHRLRWTWLATYVSEPATLICHETFALTRWTELELLGRRAMVGAELADATVAVALDDGTITTEGARLARFAHELAAEARPSVVGVVLTTHDGDPRKVRCQHPGTMDDGSVLGVRTFPFLDAASRLRAVGCHTRGQEPNRLTSARPRWPGPNVLLPAACPCMREPSLRCPRARPRATLSVRSPIARATLHG